MAADGLSMVWGEGEGDLRASRVANGVVLIDPYPEMLIHSYCQPSTCQISDSNEAIILSAIQSHLATASADNNVVAYWILDDYPGSDISPLLQKVHNLIAAANDGPTSAFPRPAICGLSANLLPITDNQVTDGDPYLKEFQTALVNFRPSYCDIIAIYSYAVNTATESSAAIGSNSANYDWSMTYLLPEVFRELGARGWDPAEEPVVGIPMSFGGYSTYVAPTEAELVTQMTAFCKAGAVALLPYTWHNDYARDNPMASFVEPFNSAYMRAGLAEGMKQCQDYWPKD